jgi:hypothetical protein
MGLVGQAAAAMLTGVIASTSVGAAMTPDGSAHYDLTVYAEYSQFYLGDSAFNADTGSPDFWSPDAIQRRLAVARPSLIGVGTSRYDDVPVVVDVLAAPPSDDLDAWDQVVEASIEVPTGRLVIDGPISWQPGDSFEVDLAPGTYRARVYYGGVGTPDVDHYRIALWPTHGYDEPQVLRAAQTDP